jgi:signal transduction histidine kinase
MPDQARAEGTGGPLIGLASRLPLGTLRMRLTLLYSALFLISGAALIVITYLLLAHQVGSFPRFGKATQNGTPHAIGGSLVPETIQNAQNNVLDEFLIQSWIALGLTLVVSIGLGWLAAGRALRPLRIMTSTARHLSEENLHERLNLQGPRELKELGNTIDGLLERLDGAFDAQRSFVANASHELRTPLTLGRALAEAALTDPDATIATFRAACEEVIAASEQQERLIEALLTLARSQRGLRQRYLVQLNEVASDVLQARDPEAAARGLYIDAAIGPAQLLGDARLVERLMLNLIQNALRYNVARGHVEVWVGTRAGRAILRVANTGPDVPATEIERLLQPFQRIAGDRAGARDSLGLGLSIVVAIARAHHANLRVESRPGGGLDIEVVFPALPAPTTGHRWSTHRTPVRSQVQAS